MHTDNIMPVRKGRVNLTQGTYQPDSFICQEDGALDVVWKDDSVETIEFAKGETAGFSAYDCNTVTIVSGKFRIV